MTSELKANGQQPAASPNGPLSDVCPTRASGSPRPAALSLAVAGGSGAASFSWPGAGKAAWSTGPGVRNAATAPVRWVAVHKASWSSSHWSFQGRQG